ncbi:hypothetical protein [Burkholderia cenocepacia]|uniref:hypothetical protein n=1 Tax=Burkholderia cenocepacia TaxID=95486 RepID=UPI002AB77986|nr:hypothetical protein [Burkholderia cenocepacia]
MATNDFLVFGGGSSPNVIDQATYAALAARLSGFQSGTALSAQLNKVWRQSSIMAAVLAQFTANFSGQNSVDDGSTATLLANLQAAINAAGITAPQFDSSTKLATTAFVQQANGNFQARQVVYGTTSITNAASGSWIECAGAGGYTITLPNPSATNLSLTFSNVSNGVVTLATPSASIYDQGNPASTFQIDQNAVVKLASDGNWVVIDCYSPTPKATSPALWDNSKRLATTAFVQGALGNFRTQVGINASTVMGAQSWGVAYTLFGAATYNVTLPPLSSGVNGAAIQFSNIGSTAYTLVGAGSDSIFNGTTSNTLVLNPGDTVILVSSGVWVMFGGSMSLLASGVMSGPGWRTQPQFDNTTRLATTAFVQRASGGVVGAVRKARMYVSAASVSANFLADEIVVETALGGGFFRLAGFNNTINLATTGVGGMDVGTAPVNGYVALYAIYNPSTATAALLATNATSVAASNVYGGGSMPSGYTASALLTVVPTNGSGQFAPVLVQDRNVGIQIKMALTSNSVVGTLTPISLASTIPPNAVSITGELSIASTSTSTVALTVAADSNSISQQNTTASVGSSGYVANYAMSISTAQTILWSSANTVGTPTYNIYVSSYTI